MSPAGYSLAVLSSNRLRFTDRLQSWIKSTVTSSENCTHSHCTWLPGSRLTRRYWLRFYAPPDTSLLMKKQRVYEMGRMGIRSPSSAA